MSLAAYFDFRLFLDQICKKEKRKKEKKPGKRKKSKETEHKKRIYIRFQYSVLSVLWSFFMPFFVGLLSAVFVSFV